MSAKTAPRPNGPHSSKTPRYSSNVNAVRVGASAAKPPASLVRSEKLEDLTPDEAAVAAGWPSYRAYLESPAWRKNPARLAAYRIARGCCRVCCAGRGVQLECHHRTYARLGREYYGDVIVVCRRCHGGITLMLKERDREDHTVSIADQSTLAGVAPASTTDNIAKAA